MQWTYGSGVRAAAVLRQGAERLVTAADSDTLAEILAVLGDVPVEAAPRQHRIEFEYDTPLSPPRLLMRDVDRGIALADVDADDAVVFGMVEARPTVRAKRAVVDPQHSLSLAELTDAVTADELILVANLREVRNLAHEADLDIAVQAILGRTGAAGVVVKAGTLGALVFRSGADAEGVPALITPVVFPVGSGDVFTAALAVHYFQSGNLVEAARAASQRTAKYVSVRHLGAVEWEDAPSATVAPTARSMQDPPRVYVAASFANPEQRWSGRVIDRGIRDIGGDSVYPLRDVGAKEDATATATADLDSLDTCDAVILLADVARTGPFFEAGWATCRGIPIVVMNSDPDPDRYTMLDGTGADLVSDLATAAYRSVWAALEHRAGRASTSKLLLLSGGLDSAAAAALEKPARALFINYGQEPAEAERSAAKAVAHHLHLELDELDIDLTAIGSGLLSGNSQLDVAPTPEWFPFRNQHLGTIAAAHALKHGLDAVVLGIVNGDGDRHADSTPGIMATLDTLIRNQEGEVRVLAPYINEQPHELLLRSGLTDEVINQTHSCHTSRVACGVCPGCQRRTEVLDRVSRHQTGQGEASDS